MVLNYFSALFKSGSKLMILNIAIYRKKLAGRYPDLAAAAEKSHGTEEEWSWLLRQSQKFGTFPEFAASCFGPVSGLAGRLEDVLGTGDEKTRWLHWLSMKVCVNFSKIYDFIKLIQKKL